MSGTRINAEAKKTAAAPFEPMSFEKRDVQAEADVERVPLFEIDGAEYTIPAVVPTGDSLKLLLQTRGMNEAERALVLIDVLAGNKALNALLGEAKLTDADWRKLITRVSDHALGRVEEPGN